MLSSRGIPPHRSLDLAYHHLSVRGEGSADDVTYGPTVGGIIAPWTNIKYKKKAAKLAEARVQGEMQDGAVDQGGREKGMRWEKGDEKPKKGEPGLRKGERYLIKDFSGLVKAGEMMLVVGRPGSGCTTFLKALSGLHHGYAGVDGEVYYGSMQGDKEVMPYKADVIFNSEEGESCLSLSVVRSKGLEVADDDQTFTIRICSLVTHSTSPCATTPPLLQPGFQKKRVEMLSLPMSTKPRRKRSFSRCLA